MAFDFKKEYREFYLPKKTPSVVTVPPMNFVAVRGNGNPNTTDGDYQRALSIVYAISYTIKMSKKTDHRIDGYYDYVVPPLEGLWSQQGTDRIDYEHKELFSWICMIRLPDFVTQQDFDWAVAEATRKKKTDFSAAQFLSYDEGLCVQCMHIGLYDTEPATLALMNEYMEQHGYALDINNHRLHHEIYLSDPRRTAADKLRTVIRHPVRQR